MPVTPPPPRTSALLPMTNLYPNPAHWLEVAQHRQHAAVQPATYRWRVQPGNRRASVRPYRPALPGLAPGRAPGNPPGAPPVPIATASTPGPELLPRNLSGSGSRFAMSVIRWSRSAQPPTGYRNRASGSATRFHDLRDALALTCVRGLRGPIRTTNTVRIMFSGPCTRRRSQVRCR
jgi:hypothetical protein